MIFSQQQQQAFEKIKSGDNVFITGPGGSGKSMMIKFVKSYFESVHKTVQVCALTGCAANLLNCEARTIHSWAGIGLGNGPNSQIINKVNKNFIGRKSWLSTRVLVVDEVSMMSKKIFELLDDIGRFTRHRPFDPFGGIQIIFLGDFFQLPPIKNEGEGNEDSGKFCFESERWTSIFSKENHIEFDTVFRQMDDLKYVEILSQVRKGIIKRKSYNCMIQMLNDYPKKISDLKADAIDKEHPCIFPTRIYPTKRKTQKLNGEELANLSGEEFKFRLQHIFNIPISSSIEEAEAHKTNRCSKEDKLSELGHIESNLLCETTLILKVGAQVMYVINNPGIGKVNGSQGIVIDFSSAGSPIVQFDDGTITTVNYHTWESERILGIGVSQIPLILSWAITIHKAQGVTLDKAEIDVGKDIFECGQTYVAMSRIKSLDGLFLRAFQYEQIKTSGKVRDFYNRITDGNDKDKSTTNNTTDFVNITKKEL